ncbi:MAG: hypothetical protein U0797_24815 [Gemmataceae bacterium]
MAVFPVALVVLAPSLETGWVGDDAMNSTLPGYWRVLEVDPATETLAQIRAWWDVGRFNPLMHVWKNAWFWCVRDLALHKSLILALVGLDLWLLYRLSRALGLGREAAALGALLAGLLIQFREYHDPVLAFNGMMQFVAALVLGSLLCLCRYRQTGRARWLVASLALHLAGCLTYECCLALCVAHAAWLPWRRAVPFVAAALLVLAVNLTVRATGDTPADSPYRMVLRGSLVWKTFTRQCVAALPLSYGAFDPYRCFAGGFAREAVRHLWIGLLVFPVACWLALRLVSRHAPIPLALLGTGFFLLPAAPIAVCHRYQWELAAGLGHLPVYLQLLGVAILLLAGLLEANRRLPERGPARLALAAIAGLACGAIAVGHRASNEVVVAALRPNYQLRSQLEEQLHAGLLDPVPSGSVLVTEGRPWEAGLHGPAFYLMHTGKRLDVRCRVEAGGAASSWRLAWRGDRWRLDFRGESGGDPR